MEKDPRGIEPMTLHILGCCFIQLPDNIIYLTVQYTYKYIQIHWKMEKDPRGIESMTFAFFGRRSNQLS